MTDLVNIQPVEKGYKKFRMKDGSGTFVAKKSDGGRWYHIVLNDGSRQRNLATAVEMLAEEVKE